jgi:acetyl-CoA carboxylase biotin carboxyl carrier protein
MKSIGSSIDETLKKQVGGLYELMKTENLDELEIKEKDFYLFVRRKSKNAPVVVQSHHHVQQVQQAQPEQQSAVVSGLTVKSPIIGVFYRAPTPSAPSFVKEGDVVPEGKILCIVEAMKVMNEIKAEYSMKILKILVENGKPITSAQELFAVEKA